MSDVGDKMMAPDSDELWEMLARYVSGESSSDEVSRVHRWLSEERSRGELLIALDQATRRYIRRLGEQPASGIEIENALERFHARVRENTEALGKGSPLERTSASQAARIARSKVGWPRRIRIALWGTAAAAVIAALLVGRGMRSDTSALVSVDGQSWATAVGQVDSLALPDGSAVILGPASQLTIRAGFGTESRVVALNGEAWFDVAQDPVRPFTVEAGIGSVVDLGTAFVVRTAADGAVRVSVTVGSVRLAEGRAAQDGVILSANDRGVLLADGSTSVEPQAATEADLAWTTGRLVFQDDTMMRVADGLRRWYGIELRWADSTLAGRHITATFERETPEQVIQVLAALLGARVEQQGVAIVLHPIN